MPKVFQYGAEFANGVIARNRLQVPVRTSDPSSPADGDVWLNTTDGVLRYRTGTTTITLNEVQLDEEGVRDVIGSALTGGPNIDVTYDDFNNTITLDVVGLTSASISDFISAVRGALSGADTATASAAFSGGVVSVDVLDSPLFDGEGPGFYTNVDNHVDGVTNHVFTAADDTKLTGIAAGATANSPDATLLARTNHTGTQPASTISDFTSAARGAITASGSATLDLTYANGVVSGAVLDSPTLGGEDASFFLNPDNHIDGAVNHVFTAADDTKLASVADGATANAPDATLLARANHTGTQTAATISDFTAAARGAITVADTATADVTYAAGAITVDVTDAPTVNGATAADLRNVDTHTSGTTNKVYTATEQAKLAAVAAGATANQTDAFLIARENHTGQQTASTISDFASAVAALNIDAETLGGMSAADLQAAVTTAIVDAAPGALDTLNELAAALGDNPNFATDVLAAIGARARFFTAGIAGGSATETVTHGLGTRNVIVQVFVNSGDYEEEEYIIRRSTPDAVTVVAEGGTIPAGRQIVITSAG